MQKVYKSPLKYRGNEMTEAAKETAKARAIACKEGDTPEFVILDGMLSPKYLKTRDDDVFAEEAAG